MFVCIFDEEKTCSGLMFAQAAYSSSFMQPARKDGTVHVHCTLVKNTSKNGRFPQDFPLRQCTPFCVEIN